MSVAWLGPPLPHGSHMSVRFRGCLGCCFTRSGSEALPPPNTLAAAEMEEGGGGEEAERWPWWAGASAAQVAAGVAWFRRGRGGAAFAMPFKAFAIATLFVGAGATAVTAGVLAAGVGSVRRILQKKKKSHRSHHVTTGFALMCSVTPRKRRWTR